MIEVEVPFYGNPGGRCVQACTAMTILSYEPELVIDDGLLDEMTGYVKGHPTWPMKGILSLYDRGYEVEIVEESDYRRFAEEGVDYLSEIYDGESLEYQSARTDFDAEQARAKEMLEIVEPEIRKATLDDIAHYLENDWRVQTEVNGCTLVGRTDYIGHFVMVKGVYDDKLVLQNPVGGYGPNKNGIENQIVDVNLFNQAWSQGNFALRAFRKQS